MVCTQQGKVESVCNPLDPNCKDDGREIYARDVEFMYCGEEAVECACSREYLDCMIKSGCATDGSSSKAQYVQQCVLTGCSTKQCGLAAGTDVCNVSTPVCANNYFRCNVQSSDQCACTKGFIDCLTIGGCALDARMDDISGFTAFDLCAAENCTANACGLPNNSEQCNQSSLVCSDHYLGCASGEQARIRFMPNDAGAVQAEVIISPDMHTVKWGAMSSFDGSGAAAASRGVHSGKYYWEVQVPGLCAVVGVARPAFDKFSYPGFDHLSWGYGDFGYGGELFNDAASRFGAPITQPAVCLSPPIFVLSHASLNLIYDSK